MADRKLDCAEALLGMTHRELMAFAEFIFAEGAERRRLQQSDDPTLLAEDLLSWADGIHEDAYSVSSS